MTALNDNGAIAFKDTGNTLLDFFMIFNRNCDIDKINEYMDKCWKIDPIKLVAIIFNSRDRVNGKKEKKSSNDAMIWLKEEKPLTYKGNLKKYVEKYGCWKDLLYISDMKKKNTNVECELFVEKLKEDKIALDNNESVSLCAKWSPSERSFYNNEQLEIAKKIAKKLYNDDERSMEKYRKEYLRPLRKKINIVEALICNNKWKEIKYEEVPSVALKRLRNAFIKHDEEGYKDYLKEVSFGRKKINTKGILPHELVEYYINNNKLDETIEMQWKTIVENIEKEGIFDDIISIVDVSGSMYNANNGSIPAQVAIALGILISICSKGIYNKKIITFHESPKIVDIKGETLYELFNSIKTIPAGLNTNFEKITDILIKYGNNNNKKIPKKLVCLSDMQFDKASHDNSDMCTTFELMTSKFLNNDYEVPSFIFWNLSSSNNTFPIQSTKDNTAIISGFSEQLLKSFLNEDNMSPEIIFDNILKNYIDEVYIDKNEL